MPAVDGVASSSVRFLAGQFSSASPMREASSRKDERSLPALELRFASGRTAIAGVSFAHRLEGRVSKLRRRAARVDIWAVGVATNSEVDEVRSRASNAALTRRVSA